MQGADPSLEVEKEGAGGGDRAESRGQAGMSRKYGNRKQREEGLLPVPAHTHFYHRTGRPGQRHRGDCPRGGPPSPRGWAVLSTKSASQLPSSELQAVRMERTGPTGLLPPASSPDPQLLSCSSPQPAAPPTTVMQLQERK